MATRTAHSPSSPRPRCRGSSPPRAGAREVVGPRDPHTPLALLGRHVVAARADDLARAPAARLVLARRLGADRRAVSRAVDRLPRAVLLRVSVPGVDLEERLLLRVVLRHGA